MVCTDMEKGRQNKMIGEGTNEVDKRGKEKQKSR